MRKFYLLLLTVLFAAIANAQVSVTATAGTVGPTPYTNLSSAFTAINAGTHQGVITVDISASFTDAATAVLNSSGAGAASYTSVLVRPSADAVTVSFASVTGRGIIELNGADNVTIDGDNPGSGGINRDLTITNTAANTITFTSVIRLASSTLITSNDNNTIRNCNLNGSGTGRNTSLFTTEVVTWGIVAAGSASTVAATTAPSALASATSTIASGQTALNFVASNNAVNTCSRGISFNGAAITVCPVLTITNNTIGNATAAATNQVYLHGISAQGFNTGTVISGNTVYVESWIGSALIGIDNGTISANGTNGIIENNIIGRIFNNSTGGFGAYGINLASSTATTNNTVRNNFITQVINKGTASFSTTFGVFGIRIGTGTNNKIHHNSVNLFGNNLGTGGNLMACFGLVVTTSTGTDVRNNIFSNTADQSAVGNVSANVCVYLPTSATSALNLTMNNNAYFTGTIVGKSGVAHVGTTYTAVPAGPATYAGLYLAANFNASTTTPNSNFRAYTNTLSVAGTNDNSSFAFTTAAPFTSATDLHIPNGTPTPLESSGTALGVTNDIDNQVRSLTTPDIGADEFAGIFVDLVAPTIAYTALPPTCLFDDRTLSGVTITDVSGVPTTGTLRPRIYYRKNAGSYFSQPGTLVSGTGINGTWDFPIIVLDMGGVAVGDVVSYYVIAQDIAAIPNIASNPGGAVATDVNTVITHPSSPSTYTIGANLNGTYTVGTGGDYATLTAAAAAYNAACLTGPVTFNLINATYTSPSETFPISFVQNASASAVNTLTIKPATTSTVTGSVANGAIIRILGNYITINGSNSLGTSRDLTLANASTTGPTVIVIGSTGAVPVTNSALKNSIVINGAQTATAIVVSDGATIGTAGNFSNITVQNNSVQRAFIGIYAIANVVAGNGNGLLVTENDLTTSGANSIRLAGLYCQGVDGATYSNNRVGNMANTADASNLTGIWFATGAVNGTISGNIISGISGTATAPRGIALSSGGAAVNTLVTGNTISGLTSSTTQVTSGINLFSTTGGVTIQNNKIRDIKNTSATSTAALGISLATTATGANILVYNNMISDVTSFGSATSTSNGNGIQVSAGSGYSIYFNTIHLNTEQTFATGIPAAINITAGVTAAGAINLRNNIFANSQTVGANRYAIYSGAANTVFAAIDYNNYYSAGPNLGFIGVNRVDLAAIQAGFGGNINSTAIQPVFMTPIDLHLNAGANPTLNNTGVTIAGITTDIDAEVRGGSPDVGADEFTPCSPAATASASSNSPVCAGATINLTGTSNGNTFQWTSSSGFNSTVQNPSIPSAALTDAGTYYFQGFLAGCPSLVSSTPVVVNPSPVISSVTATPATICYNQNSQLQVNLAAGSPLSTYALSGLTGQTYTQLTGGGITVIDENAELSVSMSNNQDDGAALITLPFTFTYFGNSFTQMTMCTNGWLGAGNQLAVDAVNGRAAGNLFTTTIPNNTIAAWFKDMGANFPTAQPGTGPGSMRHGLTGTDVYSFQWDQAVGSSFSITTTILISFQINIYGPASVSPGRIELIYGPTLGATAFAASIGIENVTGGPNNFINALTGNTTATTTSTVWPGNGNGYRFDLMSNTYSWSPSTFLNNPNIANPMASSVTSTTTYTVTVTSGFNGCTSQGNVTVTVNNPDAIATPASQSICSGDAITPIVITSSNPGTTFTWTRDNPGITGTIGNSGSGDISGTLINSGASPVLVTFTITPANAGCNGSGTYTATVLVTPAPAATISYPNPPYCTYAVSAPVTLTGTTGGTFSSTAGLTINPVTGEVNPSTSTPATYTVTYTIAPSGGCPLFTTTASITINVCVVSCIEDFDGVTVPALPSGWTATSAVVYAPSLPWATVNTSSSSAPNSAFTNDPGNISDERLDSRIYNIGTNPTQLVFRNQYDLESTFDGMVLEISINAGAFTDIITAGGSFVTGGYNSTISSAFSSPIGGSQAWSGNSGGYITTTVTLPPAALGQNVVFRWRRATDNSVSGGGANIDDVYVIETATINYAGTPYCATGTATVTHTGTPGGAYSSTAGLVIDASTGDVDLVASTPGSYTVIYTISNPAPGCPIFTTTAPITINPLPQVDPVANQIVCNGTATAAVNFTSPPIGGPITYNWTNNTPSIGLAASGSGNIGSFTATNATSAPVVATVTVTPVSGATTTFTNAAPITIPGSGTSGEASPYPSNIAVSGLIGNVTKLTVRLNNFNHTWPDDVDVLLVGPGGQNAIIMSDVGGSTDAVNLTITLDDAAASPLSDVGPLISGTFQPNNMEGVDPFNAPAPVPAGGSALSVFNGTAPNGTWSLYVMDDAGGDLGNLNGGWELNISTGAICTGPSQTFTYTVNPTPVATATPASQTRCSGVAIATIVLSSPTAGTTYAWTRDNVATVTGIAANGIGNISGTLTNTTTAPVTVTFTITPTANGCPGAPITATVLVNPTPNVVAAPTSQTICSGTPITPIALSGNVAGTTYTWTRTNTVNITGMAASGSGNPITGTLNNTTTTVQTTTFTITPSANGCAGPATTVTVTVNPLPGVVIPSVQVVIIGNGSFADEITWTLTNSLNVVVLSGGPYGLNPPPTFSAPTPSVNAPFSFFIEAQGFFNDNACLWEVRCNGVVVANGCIKGTANGGSCVNVGTLTVPGIPGCSPLAPQTICSGTAITPINLTGTVAGTTFTWTRDNNVNVTGIPASGTGMPISGTLTNTTNVPQTVIFTVIPSANGCPGPAVTISILVNPTPNAVATPSSQTICSGAAITPIVLTGNVAGTTYAWTRDNTANVTGMPAAGSGTPISGSLTNTTTSLQTTTFAITPTANGCAGPVTNATVSVQAPLILTCPANMTVNAGAGTCTAVVNFAATVTGTPVPTVTYVPASGSVFPIGTTTVTVTATNSCATQVCTFTVTVLDVQIPVITSLPNQFICVGNSVTFTAVSTFAVSFQWQSWNGSAWVNIPGATSSSYTIPSVTHAMNATSYRVRVTGPCGTVSTSNHTVLYVNSLPTIAISSNIQPQLLPGQFITLTATGVPAGGSFVWRKNGSVIAGATSATLGPLNVLDVGVYTVTYTDLNGCVSTSAPFTISALLTGNLYIYPNPNTGQFHIRFFNVANEEATVTVYNYLGAIVYQKKHMTGPLQYSIIDVDLGQRLAIGTYLVEVRNAQQLRIGVKMISVGRQ